MDVCDFCEETATRLMPQSEDQGVTVDYVKCCPSHAFDWWSGADWDGSYLEQPLEGE